ncbi:hypothetical protein BHE74_00037887 [Ensete ventricosum]|nr:hypothetical protein GW17_00032425 [Ensete ventricosum]RWW55470.1 hypothetical protein BHE74_00037887 [Ensete ventricosum]
MKKKQEIEKEGNLVSEQDDDAGLAQDADRGSGLPPGAGHPNLTTSSPSRFSFCSSASTAANRISCFALANVTGSLGTGELQSPPTLGPEEVGGEAEAESDEDEKR